LGLRARRERNKHDPREPQPEGKQGPFLRRISRNSPEGGKKERRERVQTTSEIFRGGVQRSRRRYARDLTYGGRQLARGKAGRQKGKERRCFRKQKNLEGKEKTTSIAVWRDSRPNHWTTTRRQFEEESYLRKKKNFSRTIREGGEDSIEGGKRKRRGNKSAGPVNTTPNENCLVV